ncbi:MAG: zinc finger Ran-binding domain-containing family 2 protein [Clostridia bacterium]|nr:zinc finger Ran-binding domain-containing family 2 protein [Clostridia bacterium]
MRKLLIILLVINVITLAIAFIMSLVTAPLYAVLFLLLGILELVPIIAIISCLDDIDKLKQENAMLSYRLKKLENEVLPEDPVHNSFPELAYGEPARAIWECVKCGTVNKAGTTQCSHCKAPYSPFINPTDDPTKKKKRSRWIKDKK